MTSSGRGRGATYADTTKRQIVRAVLGQPGRTGGQIARSLGLEGSRVNSFLYDEGLKRFGLVCSNWRWYPGSNVPASAQISPIAGSVLDEAPQTDSICVILSKMSLTNATLKIRTFSLSHVELTFSEDEYQALDERLQAELIMRKKSLEAASKEVQIVKQAPGRWVWAVVAVLGVWVLLLLGNQKQADYEKQPKQGGETERVLPVR